MLRFVTHHTVHAGSQQAQIWSITTRVFRTPARYERSICSDGAGMTMTPVPIYCGIQYVVSTAYLCGRGCWSGRRCRGK